MVKRRRVEMENDYADSEDELSSIYNNSDSEIEPENETESDTNSESESYTEDS